MAEERVWTDEQRLAIDTRDRTLLVSAAAGSGKTATLTERIIQSLLDEENPENINEILIVTFTKAAVAELRDRIGAAIKAAIKKNPENERLRRQLALLPSAKIQTIDSFCVDILRKNCDKVGVSPLFRIPDEAEAKLLSISTMEKLIDAVYEGLLPEVASAEEFEVLADGLTSSKAMNDLAEIFISIYENLRSNEAGVDSLIDLVNEYQLSCGEDVSASRPIAYAILRIHAMAEHYKRLFERAECELGEVYDKNEKFVMMCRGDVAFTKALLEADSYREICEVLFGDLQVQKAKLSVSSNEAMRFAVRLRAELDSDVEYFKEKIFFLSEEELTALYIRLHKQLLVLHRFISRFDRDFREEKRRLAICEFSDIERYTYECLYDGAPTETARAEAARYSSIYIDEYQDVDGIQNRIFESISKGGNRFMVGDIKQSIYGFRGAKPEIFADMKRRFSDLHDSAPGSDTVLFMSKNFRSELPIISFANEIFDKLFSLAGDSIGYREEDRLTLGKKESQGLRYPEIHVLPKVSGSANHDFEPSFIANMVRELIENETLSCGKRISASDVAVLLRSDKGRGAKFARALDGAGIDAFVPGTKSFLLCEEVLLALCILNSVDNPRKDIYLAGLMRSPLFDFTADELVRIRRGSRSDTLYGALVEYCEKNGDYLHGREFIAALKKYRYISEGLSVDEVIDRLYRETGIMALSSEEGKKNLTLLYEYARSFESSSFKGLYNFIRYINDVIADGVRFDERRESSDAKAVKIITVHSSKGLEFPIVFLADAAKAVGRRENGRLAYADGFAISTVLRTESGLAVLQNPVNNIIADYKAQCDFEEDLRVLYVALTRAKERLFVVGTSTKKNMNDLKEDVEFIKKTLSSYSVYKLPSYLISVLAATGVSARTEWHDYERATDWEEAGEKLEKSKKNSGAVPSVSKEELLFRFGFKYPREHLTRLPEKMAVSYLYPTVLDGTESAPLYEILNTGRGKGVKIKPKRKVLPLFMSDSDPDDSAKRGVATHLFMQFCDLERLSEFGVKEELHRLVSERFISEQDKERVRIDEIELFLKSELLSEMRGAKKIYRELRFNVKLPAARFTGDPEKREAYEDRAVLVQGVIDCIIEREDGELILVDYKTDRLSGRELSDKALAAQKLTRSHASQLSYYKMAVEKMFGKTPLSVLVYSLPLGDTVEINVN